MKAVLNFFLFTFLVATGSSVPATITCEFDPNNPIQPAIEYVVEEEQQDGSWLEVASGPQSPIVYSRDVKYGQYRCRVFVRLTANPLPRDVSNDTSNVAVTIVKPKAPKDAAVSRTQ